MSLKIKVTFETRRLLILSKRTEMRIWCGQCEAEAAFLAFEELEGSGISLKNMDESQLHKIRLTDGKELICLSSMLKSGE